MSFLPKSIEKTIEEFSKLPGVGPKTAERLVFYLLKKPVSDIERFGDILTNLKTGILYCETCKNLTTETICPICTNSSRDSSMICVVEDALDLIALEKSNEYRGVYHVLHGIISPIDGIGPEELTIDGLIDRVKKGGIKEVIIALNPSVEGEATATYITRHLESYEVRITRIARGIPVGGHLEYADSQTLRSAMNNRTDY